MPKQVLATGEERMKKSIESLTKDFGNVRTGKANPAILNNIVVEYWGTPTPLYQVASINAPDSQTITVKPYDKSLVKTIEKAILVADLGLNPSNDGEMVRIPIPPLNEATRKDLVKVVKKLSEEAKVAIRNIRRDIIEQLKKMEKDSVISEDTLRQYSDETQKLTDKYIAEIDKKAKEKEQAIMSF